MGEVVNFRYHRYGSDENYHKLMKESRQRKEEKEAEQVRLAKQVMGLIPGPYDTAPSEYCAPERDPA